MDKFMYSRHPELSLNGVDAPMICSETHTTSVELHLFNLYSTGVLTEMRSMTFTIYLSIGIFHDFAYTYCKTYFKIWA